MKNHVKRLVAIGFKEIGHWSLKGDNRTCVPIIKAGNERDVLYAFVVGSSVKYIGRSMAGISTRLKKYPHERKMRKYLLKTLLSHKKIKILQLMFPYQFKFGEFDFNIPAGIEDSIIGGIQPAWNT